MKNFVIGQYVPGKSYLYKIDPRAKILTTLIFMVAIFFLKNIYEILGALTLIIAILLSGRLSIFKAIKGLKPLIVLSIFVFIFQVFFNQTGTLLIERPLTISILSILSALIILFLYFFFLRVVKYKGLYFLLLVILLYLSFRFIPAYPKTYYTYNLQIYKDGLMTSLFVFFRLIAVVFIATILTLTTKPTDLTLALEWLSKPLKIFKVNPEEVALIITIALRYIPTIIDEAYKIMDAQASRGADFREGSIGNKISQLVSLLVPMFVISFERSDELADAMLSRNFVPGKPKTRYHMLKWRTFDFLVIAFSLLTLGGAICLFILL